MWYRALSRRVVFKDKNAEVLARVAVDQTLFSPTFLVIFLSTMAYCEGRDPKENIKKNFFPILATNYMVWPWVQLANFKFVPLNHRLNLANTVAIGWTCYLSYMNSRGR
jgi:protein Mpv17